MARYRVGFSVEQYGYYYFDAESLEQAQDLVERVERFDIDEDDLPSFYRKVNGGQSEFISDVEEVI